MTSHLASFDALIRGSIELYRSRFQALLGIAAIPAFYFLVGELIAVGLRTPATAAIGILVLIMGIPWYFLSSAAFLYAIKDGGDAWASYKAAWQNIWDYSWVSILSILIIMGGFFLAVIPGFLFAVWFGFALMVYVFEGKTGMKALMQSKAYARGRWWGIFWRTSLFGMLLSILSSAAGSFGFVLGTIPGQLLQGAVQAFLMPLYIIFTCKLYMNLRETAQGSSQPPEKANEVTWTLIAMLPFIVPLGFLLALLLAGVHN